MEKKRNEAVPEVPVQEQASVNSPCTGNKLNLTKLLSKLINMNFEESKIIVTVTYLDH